MVVELLMTDDVGCDKQGLSVTRDDATGASTLLSIRLHASDTQLPPALMTAVRIMALPVDRLRYASVDSWLILGPSHVLLWLLCCVSLLVQAGPRIELYPAIVSVI